MSVTSPLSLPALLRGAAPLAGALSLSPSQRAIAERSYDGPALVSGGPGTGKTTVAVHRAAYLASRLGAADGAGGPGVLLVTFSKHLAAQLRDRLARLDPAGRDRVEVVNIDALAARVVAAAEPGVPRHWLDEPRALDIWRSVLAEPGLPAERVAGFSPEFLYDEWARVILGHAVNSRLEYYRVRRAGRGRHLNRAQRAVVWELAERFGKRLTEANLWTFRQLIAYAVELASARPQLRAPHVVVDEAQDLSPAQLMLLRALAAPGPDDLFLASDPRQAIHAAVAPLAAAGIDVRGREERLTLSYRPTREIFALATRLDKAGEAGPEVAEAGSAEHASAGAESAGERAREQSLLRGAEPELRGHATWAEELDAITSQVAAWLSPATPDLHPLASRAENPPAQGPPALPSPATRAPLAALPPSSPAIPPARDSPGSPPPLTPPAAQAPAPPFPSPSQGSLAPLPPGGAVAGPPARPSIAVALPDLAL
ncbi:MAG TPA: UvrD-helicase domain-containing protein, partial [Trebonia sp.]|nr:UvrD-helicase domain-containing protein [Trebonia sp.]